MENGVVRGLAMKWIAVALSFGSLSVFGSDGSLPQADVGVYLTFKQPIPEGVLRGIQAEVQGILSRFGFRLHWREMASAGAETWADLAVVTFEGACDPSSEYPAFVPGVLGWTHITDGTIQPYATIDCDRIGSQISTRLFAFPAGERSRLLERAVARVVAHELYHIFARSTAHEDSGVGKAEFTASDLLSDQFSFYGGQARALRLTSAEDQRQFAPRP